jgi:serine/threonine protein kinase
MQADIWSIGIIFFQMIYGTYPYDSSTAPQMYREIQTKRLFNKNEPFVFNGYTPSQEAYNFLKFTIVVETDRRPDWRAISEYPSIKRIEV